MQVETLSLDDTNAELLATNEIFRLPSHSARQKINLEYANANYGVINRRTLELVSLCFPENQTTLLTKPVVRNFVRSKA